MPGTAGRTIMNTTTKRYPRTTTEAFPDADRAGCIQGPYRDGFPLTSRLLALAAALVAVIVLATVGVSHG